MTRRRAWDRRIAERILGRDEHKCIYCGIETNGIDHVIPISEGGFHIPANAVCCCRSCNAQKGKKLDEYWIIKGLQRLIQHSEDVSWIATILINRGFTEEVGPTPRQKLLSLGLSVEDINDVFSSR